MCIFCKIINKEIPAYIIHEDENTIAFLDRGQSTKGHTLVIPKKHCTDIFELEDNIARDLYSSVVKVSKILKDKLNCEGINILNNNREVAGQVVFHYHIHLLPRYSTNDDVKFYHKDKSPELKPEDYEKLKVKITS